MTWRTYLCEISDKSALVLIEDRFADQFPVDELPLLSWFGVYCNKPTEGAFWNPDETNLLDRLENDLLKLSEQFGHGWAVYVFRLATTGIREYYLYHTDAAEMRRALEELRRLYPNYRIDFDTTDDAKWEQYRRYVSLINETA